MSLKLPPRPDLDQLRRQAKDLHRAAAQGDPLARARIEAFSSNVTLATAQLTIAREHGFASWPRLSAEVERRALLNTGDVEGLKHLLSAERGLASERFANWCDHQLSPLGYISLARFHRLLDHRRTADLARALIDAGAPVDGDPADRETPLITAASYGEVEVARVLLDAGANLEARGFAVPGGTALAHAVHFGMRAIVDLLVQRGAVIHNLTEAAGAGKVGQFLKDASTLEECLGAFRAAVVCERLDAIETLLNRGVAVGAAVDGATALHWAAWEGKAASARYLLDRGADPNAIEPDHHLTPLGWARHRHREVGEGWGHAEVEQLLVPITGGGSRPGT